MCTCIFLYKYLCRYIHVYMKTYILFAFIYFIYRNSRLTTMPATEVIRYLNLSDVYETNLNEVKQVDRKSGVPSKTRWLTQEQLKSHQPQNRKNIPVSVHKPSIVYRTKNGDLLTERGTYLSCTYRAINVIQHSKSRNK
jgi:hypothetical protein